jgi:hypothetical protein
MCGQAVPVHRNVSSGFGPVANWEVGRGQCEKFSPTKQAATCSAFDYPYSPSYLLFEID